LGLDRNRGVLEMAADDEYFVTLDRSVLICVLQEMQQIVSELEEFYTGQAEPWGEGEAAAC